MSRAKLTVKFLGKLDSSDNILKLKPEDEVEVFFDVKPNLYRSAELPEPCYIILNIPLEGNMIPYKEIPYTPEGFFRNWQIIKHHKRRF